MAFQNTFLVQTDYKIWQFFIGRDARASKAICEAWGKTLGRNFGARAPTTDR